MERQTLQSNVWIYEDDNHHEIQQLKVQTSEWQYFLDQIYLTIGGTTNDLIIQKAFEIQQNKDKYKFIDILENHLLKDDNLNIVARQAHKTVERIYKMNIPSYFIHSLNLLLKNHNRKVDHFLNKPKIISCIDIIEIKEALQFIKCYNIILPKQKFEQVFYKLICQKEFKSASAILKYHSYGLETLYLNFLVDQIINHQGLKQHQKENQAKQAARIIKQHGQGYKQFPQITDILLKNAARYFLNKGWDRFQEIFQSQKTVLAYGIQILIKYEKNIAAASICYRNPSTMNYISQKTKILIEKIYKTQQPYIPIKNIFHKNIFQPYNKDCLDLEKDFKIKYQDISLLDDDTQKVQQILEEILNSDIIALDTQSLVVRTTLHKQLDVLAVIQVSTRTKIYIIDAFKMKSQVIIDVFKKFVQNPKKKLIVHAKGTDQKLLYNILNVKPATIKCQIIDICQLTSKKYKCGKGLSAICKKLLQKYLCKQCTLSNWGRRPLLKNQIHYAALDSYVLIKIWEKVVNDQLVET